MSRQPFLQAIENEALLDGRFTDIHRIDPQGGNGYFSLLFTAYDEITKAKVALKFFDPTKTDDSRVARFKREGEVLQYFADEEYVIDCVGGGSRIFNKVFVDPMSGASLPFPLKYIAMELADSSVEDFIYDNHKATPLGQLKCFKEMAKAVFRIHNHKVCHRDLKPGNFLVCGKKIKISDFGTAKFMDSEVPEIALSYDYPVGDMNYCGPELFLSFGIADELVFRSDMFSLGAILFEMFTYQVLTTEIYTQSQINNLFKASSVLKMMTPTNKSQVFWSIIDDLAKQIQLPDVSSYNDFVPGCIVHHLNSLYKSLSHVNPAKRIVNPISLHRKIDMCILTLENEIEYQYWIKNKRVWKLNSLVKIKSQLERLKC